MAILNIKNVPDALYRRLQPRARRQRRSVSQEVIQIPREATERPQRLSILALRGLGKELWKDVDAAVQVETERSAWD